jgi:hypothetical protein
MASLYLQNVTSKSRNKPVHSWILRFKRACYVGGHRNRGRGSSNWGRQVNQPTGRLTMGQLLAVPLGRLPEWPQLNTMKRSGQHCKCSYRSRSDSATVAGT